MLLTSALICGSAGASGAEPGAALHELFDSAWQKELADDPLAATSLGDIRYNDRWTDMSLAAIKQREQRDRATLDALNAEYAKIELDDQDADEWPDEIDQRLGR